MKNSVLNISKKVSFIALMAGTIAFSMAGTASSQTQSEVFLQSPDGDVSIIGRLLNVDDEFYTVEGALGAMKIPRASVECTGEGCPSPDVDTSASADISTREVVLASIDDETRILGELIDVEEKHYVIRNALGEFRIAFENVNCLGPACPIIETYTPEFTIFAETPKVNTMLVDLLLGYAEQTGQTFEFKEEEGTARSVQIFSAEDNELVADINLEVKTPQDAVIGLSNRSADILVYEQQEIDRQLATNASLGDLLQNPLAFDGQVIVGNRDNPVRDLSLNEIEQIWSNDLTSWRSLGAGEAPITVHMVEDNTDSAEWLNGLQSFSTPGVITHSTEVQVIEAVKADPNALGVVHRASANNENAKMLALRKVCGLIAEPTPFGIRTQDYPFTQPIYSYGRGTGMHPFAQSFLEWTQTAAASASISKSGFTTAGLQRIKIQDMGVAVVHTAAVEPDFDGAEFSTMMRELRSADRLSMTFRFLTGSSVLDDESVLTVKDLANRLRGNEFDGQEVLLVGFADSTGPAGPNTSLSARRAETVRQVLSQEFDETTRDRLNVTDMGFGEQMPVDCNNTDAGRASNRRVEVWVRVQS